MARTFQMIAGHPVLDFVNTLDYRFGPSPQIELLASYADLAGFIRQSGLGDERIEAGLQSAAHTPAAAGALRKARELREALALWFYGSAELGGSATLGGGAEIGGSATLGGGAALGGGAEIGGSATLGGGAALGRGEGADPARAVAIETLQRCFLDADRHRELVQLSVNTQGRDSNPPLRLAWTWGRFDHHPRLPVWMLAHSAADLLTSEHTDRIHQCKSDSCRWLFLDMSKNHTRRWCDMNLCGNRMKARRHQQRLKPGSSPAGSRAPSTN